MESCRRKKGEGLGLTLYLMAKHSKSHGSVARIRQGEDRVVNGAD